MKRSLLVVMCLVAVAVAGPASAATLSLDYLIGTVLEAEPANVTAELGYANTLIDWYNGGTNPNPGAYVYALAADKTGVPGSPGSGSLDPATDGVKFDSVEGELPGPVDLTGYTYLWAKFGKDGALYFLDGSVTSLTGLGFIPAYGPFAQQGGGLSHVTLFGPGTTQVPEAGALLMFGTGLIGLVGYRRIRRMQ